MVGLVPPPFPPALLAKLRCGESLTTLCQSSQFVDFTTLVHVVTTGLLEVNSGIDKRC